MHDVHGKTVDMMKKILPTLKAEGFKFAKLTDVPSVKRALGDVSAATSGDRPVVSPCDLSSGENSRWVISRALRSTKKPAIAKLLKTLPALSLIYPVPTVFIQNDQMNG